MNLGYKAPENLPPLFADVTPEILGNYRRNILGLVEDVADEEIQRRFWVKGEGPDFDEYMLMLLGDFSLRDFVTHCQAQGLWTAQTAKLQPLCDALEAYNDKTEVDPDPQRVIDDPEWAEIRRLAKEVLEVSRTSEGA